MASSSPARVFLRLVFFLLLLVVALYVGRPLYWKLSAIVHDIREKRQTVKGGISQFVLDAQRSVGWFNDESDSGIAVDRAAGGAGVATARRILRTN